jgi:hypothetical protein
MSIQSAARAQFSKIKRIAESARKTVTFRLFDDIDYDPTSGTLDRPPTAYTITALMTLASTKETASGPIVKTEYKLMFEPNLLSRPPTTQDEVIIDNQLYKVTQSSLSNMDVYMTVHVLLA